MLSPELLLLGTFIIVILLLLVFWPDRGLAARVQRTRKLTTRMRLEDALKHLFACEIEERSPSLEGIAGVLQISHNEAAEVVSLMEKRELIFVERGILALTDLGRDYALRVVRAHRLWERYLSDKTGYTEVEWHSMAEREEHLLSVEDADDLAVMLGNPTHDPHGDPIPTSDGAFAEQKGQPLSRIASGQTVKILHIEDEPELIYSQIVAEGLHTGMVLRVLDTSPRRIRFWAHGNEHVLSPLLAANISVRQVHREMELAEPGMPLDKLGIGSIGTVVRIAPGIRGSERRRLLDLGLLPGTEIKAEMKSPGGDPTAYLVRGALIALRADQARHIKIFTEGSAE